MVFVALRQASGKQPIEHPPAHARLDEGRRARIRRHLVEVKDAIKSAVTLDQAANDAVEAMALNFWKQRWRLYELWLLCVLCDVLIRSSDGFDTAGRIANGRWTLKFTKDSKPVIACAVGGAHLDIYYQYFSPGAVRGNMPDIAVRDRHSGQWLVVLDPKSGNTYTPRDLGDVCLRYADAFDAKLSLVANYFPDEARVETLTHVRPAVVYYGLRPHNVAGFNRMVTKAINVAGIAIKTATVVVLVDISSSMATRQASVAESLHMAIKAASSPDLDHSCVAFFADDWIAQTSLGDYVRSPSIPSSQGGTNYRAAVTRSMEYLQTVPGDRAIWLFGDGEDTTDWDDLVDCCLAERIQLHAYVFRPTDSPTLKAVCATIINSPNADWNGSLLRRDQATLDDCRSSISRLDIKNEISCIAA